MHLKTILFLLVVSTSSCSRSPAQQPVIIDPNDIQISPYRHDELPAQMLVRIHATTETFESIDGITYEEAVDLYKRDLNPEENLVVWEGMAKAYKTFCRSRCSTPAERMDVYRSLLLRSMFPEEQALAKTELKVLSKTESKEVMQLYGLPPKPIDSTL